MPLTSPAQPSPATVITDQLGSFWTQYYQDRPGVDAVAKGLVDLAGLVADRLAEAQAAVSRHTLPCFRTARWYPLRIRESGRSVAGVRYGEDRVYGDGLAYGDASASTYPLPTGLIHVPQIYNRLTAPTVSWLDTIDYSVDSRFGLLRFRVDPFTDLRFVPDEITENGVVIDREIILWAHGPDIQAGFGRDHAAYLIDDRPVDSPADLTVVNAVLDSDVLGPSTDLFLRALEAATGLPLSGGDETVEVVTSDAGGLVVVTTSRVYRFSSTAVPLVAVGDVLVRGQALCDGLVVSDLSRGEVPDVLILVLGPGILIGRYNGPLGFPNRIVPVVYSGDGLDATFEVAGHPFDVEAFWVYVRRKEDETGQKVRDLLGGSSTVNPAQFVVENLLRHGVLHIRIKADRRGEASALSRLPQAVSIRTPYSAILILIDAATAEVASLQPSDDGNGVGYGLESVVVVSSPPEDLGGRLRPLLFGCA